MIAGLVPAAVATAVTRADLLHSPLHPEEERSLGRATPARRREFATARACARAALGRLGATPAAIVSGPRGEPLWPDGVVGSITHCAGLRACAVARADAFRALGIDAEPHAPLPAGVLEAVAGADERRALAARSPAVRWDRLLFSAKEAVFKAWYPLTGRSLGFEDVDLRFLEVAPARTEAVVADSACAGAPRTAAASEPAGAFEARLLVRDPRAPARLRGRWRLAGGTLATAVVVEAAP